jgi:formate dehydrogenase subunit beta
MTTDSWITTLQSEVARLLEDGRVVAVIGFEAGSLPLRARPTTVRRPEAAGKVVQNGFCQNNLATYLHHRSKGERIGLICRGCESRAVRALVVEQQMPRNEIYLIGVPCHGIIDARKIDAQVREEVLAARETETEIVVATRSGERRLLREEMLHGACLRCRFPNPVGADIMIGSPVPERDRPPVRDSVRAFEALTAEARHAFFTREVERCIRCYACREACPMCYCSRCVVDGTAPRWIESTIRPAGTQAWHIVRAFHQTGRCVSCGACERVCPMEIPMTYLTDQLNRQMEETYGFVVGEEEGRQPPLAAFSLDDAGHFER